MNAAKEDRPYGLATGTLTRQRRRRKTVTARIAAPFERGTKRGP